MAVVQTGFGPVLAFLVWLTSEGVETIYGGGAAGLAHDLIADDGSSRGVFGDLIIKNVILAHIFIKRFVS